MNVISKAINEELCRTIEGAPLCLVVGFGVVAVGFGVVPVGFVVGLVGLVVVVVEP